MIAENDPKEVPFSILLENEAAKLAKRRQFIGLRKLWHIPDTTAFGFYSYFRRLNVTNQDQLQVAVHHIENIIDAANKMTDEEREKSVQDIEDKLNDQTQDLWLWYEVLAG